MPIDKLMAAQFCKIAAVYNHTRAQVMLADIYKNGRGGVPKNIEESIRLYQRAAKQGDAFALFCLGELCEDAVGVKRNLPLAARFYEIAYNKGYDNSGYFDNFMKANPTLKKWRRKFLISDSFCLIFKKI